MDSIIVNMREEFMMLAIEKAWEGVKTGQEPFGSIVVKGDEVLSVSGNTIKRDNDPSAHAEMNAIREACKKIGAPNLSGCEIYASFKPCDMCMEAIKRAGITKVYYGAGPEDVEYPSASNELIVKPGILRDRCLDLVAVKYHPL